MGLLRTATRPIDTHTNIIRGTQKNFKGLLVNLVGLLYNLETIIMAPQIQADTMTGVGRRLPVKKITVRSKYGPVIPAFFTFNRMTQRFEMWGSPSYPQDLPFLADNPNGPANNSVPARSLPSPNASPEDFERPWYLYNPNLKEVVVGGRGVGSEAYLEFDPDTYNWDLEMLSPKNDLGMGAVGGAVAGQGIEWPWWFPNGYHLFYSGNKLDNAMENPDPGKGNLGLRVGPFIGPSWHWSDSVGARNELYLGCQIPQLGQRHGGIPETYWDLAGRVGYRYHPPEGQGCGFCWGAGTYFQWTNDEAAGGQSNPWGETIGRHHLDPYVEIHTEWDWNSAHGIESDVDFHISVELSYDGDIRGGVTISGGF